MISPKSAHFSPSNLASCSCSMGAKSVGLVLILMPEGDPVGEALVVPPLRVGDFLHVECGDQVLGGVEAGQLQHGAERARHVVQEAASLEGVYACTAPEAAGPMGCGGPMGAEPAQSIFTPATPAPSLAATTQGQ
jgi:hypothetical protein